MGWFLVGRAEMGCDFVLFCKCDVQWCSMWLMKKINFIEMQTDTLVANALDHRNWCLFTRMWNGIASNARKDMRCVRAIELKISKFVDVRRVKMGEMELNLSIAFSIGSTIFQLMSLLLRTEQIANDVNKIADDLFTIMRCNYWCADRAPLSWKTCRTEEPNQLTQPLWAAFICLRVVFSKLFLKTGAS